MELMVVIAIIGILATFAIMWVRSVERNACEVTVKHDLKNFANLEKIYYLENGVYVDAGSLPNMKFSDKIVIVFDPGDPENPLTARARAYHQKYPAIVYLYDFATDTMTKE